ncbi:peptidoglycan-binding domain-containing protein [Pyxidicoccus trucidator]|uniref:peptidoglycan-binding domain-containing protein n=1 Tax=Pyxidicoccus trucidator TaxID=2709662 RepID=UPI0013DC6DA1|nr:peptidoglycan-binding domain-containing protein [Pyxidicoccus trucidator]
MPPPEKTTGSSTEKFQAMDQESREEFTDVDAESPTLPCEKDDVWVRIAFKDDFGEPYADVAFVLEVKGQQWKGRTTSAGVVEHVVPADATEGVLKLWFDGEEEGDEPFTYTLALGQMDPVALETGQRSRLENLGLFGLDADGPASGTFEDALYTFQEWAGLEETGKLDGATERKLKLLYSPLGKEPLPPPAEEDVGVGGTE